MFRQVRESIYEAFKGPGGVLFALALAVYLPGLLWGMPYASARTRSLPWGSDELAPLQSITEIYGVFFARHPNFNPQYPLFHNMMQALLVGPYMFYLWLTGRLGHPEPLYPFGMTDPVSSLWVTTLLARIVSWLMAGGVVVAAYRTGVILRDRLTGWIYGVVALSLYPMFYYSRTSNVDMGALFWTALGLVVFAEAWKHGVTSRRAVWLGVFAALATASKDASWPAFLMMGLILVRAELASPLGETRRDKLRPLVLGVLVGAATYITASGLIFRPSRYMLHLKWISGSGFPPSERVPITLSGYSRLALNIGRNLIDALGAPMALCVIAGIVVCLLHNRRMLNWLLPAAGIIVLVLGPARFVLIRYVMVVAYILSFFAALALREAWESKRLRKAAPALLVIVAGWSLVHGADLTWQMLHDPRYTAGQLIHRYGRPGDRVLHFVPPSNLPAIEAGIKNIQVRKDAHYEFKRTMEDPEFVLLVPFGLMTSEVEHEPNIPEQDYQALRNGSLGYQRVMEQQAARLFERRPIPWVNPKIQLFVRKDVIAGRVETGQVSSKLE